MPIEIRETIVTPSAGGDVVQIHISDVPPNDESATFVVRILAKLKPVQNPLLAQHQREAMKQTQDVLSELLRQMAKEITDGGFSLDARGKGQTR